MVGENGQTHQTSAAIPKSQAWNYNKKTSLTHFLGRRTRFLNPLGLCMEVTSLKMYIA